MRQIMVVIGVAAVICIAAMFEFAIAEPEWTPVIDSVKLSTEPCLYVCTSEGCGADQHQNHGLCWSDCTHGGDQHGCGWALHDCDDSEHSCSPDPVPVPEPTAAFEPLRDQAFWEALQSADGKTLRTFVKNNGAVASVNTQRRSLQVRGCNDAVVANIPLTSQQLAMLVR